jgi:predicted transcriptional regulator
MYPDIFFPNMDGAKTTTIRIEGRALKRVDSLARAMSRSRAWVINQAIDRYLGYEEWFAAQVEEGLKEARAGKVVEHKAVVKKWERKRAARMDTRRQPRP